MTLHLKGAFSNNPRVRPLLDGTIQPTGIEIEWDSGSPADLHERHLRDDDCDVFEFSISHLMESKAKPSPRWDWSMLPVYMSKALLCVNSLTNVNSGVESAQDLKGKRFGVPDYSMTAALWFRAMLRELYGYHPWDVSWFVGRTLEHSHTELVGVSREKLSSRVSITWPDRAGALGELLLAGDIDAAWGSALEGIPADPPPTLRPLFPDGGLDFVGSFVQRTGFGPVNHTVVVQNKLLEKEPWVAEALYEAFEKSKAEA
ncbi:MAG TPA: hypothetical protein VGK54_16510, partial [Chloroflexota bacterium]